MSRLTSLKLVLTGFLLAGTLIPGLVQARGFFDADTKTTISVSELPQQGVQTYELIHQGALGAGFAVPSLEVRWRGRTAETTDAVAANGQPGGERGSTLAHRVSARMSVQVSARASVFCQICGTALAPARNCTTSRPLARA